MSTIDNGETFAGSVAVRSSGPADTLVICCSASDHHGSVIEFLAMKHNLHPYQFDLVALPGSVYKFTSSRGKRPMEIESALTDVDFLMRAHNTQHVMLFGHVPCDKYKACGYNDEVSMRQAIRSDLFETARMIRNRCGQKVVVEAYISDIADGRMQFHSIDLSIVRPNRLSQAPAPAPELVLG